MGTRTDLKKGAAPVPPAFRWADRLGTPSYAEAAQPQTGARARDGKRSLSYMPSLDGLRALAVVAVLLYHADLEWASGGFLGVDVFFVISGYLITALLLRERSDSGRIDLVRFWKRRAMRLLPALLVLLAFVAAVIPILAPDQNGSLRGDLLAALTYSSNWWLIFQDQPYFQAMNRPPVLQHLWSLAVEEQFYLLWPPLLALLLHSPFRRARPLAKWTLLLVAASAIAMSVMYSPEADPSRLYYGTDTRVGTILVGSALAFLWRPGNRSAAPGWAGNAVRDVAGFAALAALGWVMTTWTSFEPILYRGGFTLVAFLAAVAVAVAAHPGPVTRHVIGSAPLRWLGKRSYSIYLWHWPVYMLTRPQLDIDLDGPSLLALRLSLTLLLSAASYKLVEEPVRNGALGRAFERLQVEPRSRTLRGVTAGVGTLALPALVAGALAAGVLVARDAPLAPAEAALRAASQATLPAADGAGTPMAGIRVTEQEALPQSVASNDEIRLVAIGDSVMLFAKEALASEFEGAIVSADVGRQTKGVITIAEALRDQGRLGNRVIVHMGTNGVITEAQLDHLMTEVLQDVPKVILVNVKVDRPWEKVNNRLLADKVESYPNAVLADWKGVATRNPDAFYRDGVHLRPGGIGVYLDLLRGTLAG